MCQLALDMFGQTLNERNIQHSFRYENYARFFHKKCSVCSAAPYLPVEEDLLINGLAWQLPDAYADTTVAQDFRTICLRCAVSSQANIGFWIPTVLRNECLEYFMYDGYCLGADAIAFIAHPQSTTSAADMLLTKTTSNV